MTTGTNTNRKALLGTADPPLILDIKGNSLDDGPGIRSVVFFKGCPLSCVWCHNPESKKRGPEISFSPDDCVGCNACMDACPAGALSGENPFYIDRKKCDLCFRCIPACPSGALEQVGREMTEKGILDRVIRDKVFFDASGGGVTFSGGEPTLHMPFLSGLIQSAAGAGLHTLLETCGLFDREAFDTLVLPHIHTVYFDIKIVDAALHRQYCGAANRKILENFRHLAALAAEGRLDLLPRVPLVPGITATEANLSAIAALLLENNIPFVKLLAYNPLWTQKPLKIGVKDKFSSEKASQDWIPSQDLDRMERIFRKKGIEITD